MLDVRLKEGMDEKTAIKAMDSHAEAYGIRVTTIGQQATGNRHAYDRLQRGTAHVDTARKVLEWIEADAQSRKAGAA